MRLGLHLKKFLFLLFILPASCSDLARFTANLVIDSNTSIILNEGSLFSFMKERDNVVNVVNTLQGLRTNSFSDEGELQIQNTSFTLTIVGEVDSPVVDGVTLQATSIALRGNRIYVSYNTRGDVYKGALDVIKVSNPKKPKLESRTIFNNIDINAVYYHSNKLLLAQALETGVDGFNSRLVTLSLVKNKYPDFDTMITQLLPSNAGTSVFAKSNIYYVTSGASGGI